MYHSVFIYGMWNSVVTDVLQDLAHRVQSQHALKCFMRCQWRFKKTNPRDSRIWHGLPRKNRGPHWEDYRAANLVTLLIPCADPSGAWSRLFVTIQRLHSRERESGVVNPELTGDYQVKSITVNINFEHTWFGNATSIVGSNTTLSPYLTVCEFNPQRNFRAM